MDARNNKVTTIVSSSSLIGGKSWNIQFEGEIRLGKCIKGSTASNGILQKWASYKLIHLISSLHAPSLILIFSASSENSQELL